MLNIVIHELIVVAKVVFCVMSWIMLLSKKGDFVREIKKDMERCLWVAK